MLKRIPIFTVKIIYKSGAVHTFETTKFTVKGGSYHWENVDNNNKPVVIGVDEIAAVWQVGCRYKWSWV